MISEKNLFFLLAIIYSQISYSGDGVSYFRFSCMPEINTMLIDNVKLWDGNDWEENVIPPKGHDLYLVRGGEKINMDCEIRKNRISIKAYTPSNAYAATRLSMFFNERKIIEDFRLGWYSTNVPYLDSVTYMHNIFELCGINGTPSSHQSSDIRCTKIPVSKINSDGYTIEKFNSSFKK